MKTEDGQALGKVDMFSGNPLDAFKGNLARHFAYVVNRTLNTVSSARSNPTHASQSAVRAQGLELKGAYTLMVDLLGYSAIPEEIHRETLAAIESAVTFTRTKYNN